MRCNKNYLTQIVRYRELIIFIGNVSLPLSMEALGYAVG